MIRKKKQKSNTPQTVSSLNRSVSKSFFKKAKVKFIAFIGRLKKFYRDYRLPSIASIAFLLLIMTMAIVRQLEQTSLLALRNDISNGGDGYSLLISNDESDEFSRDDTVADGQPENSQNSTSNTNSTQSTSNSFTLVTESESSTTSSGGSSSGGSSSGGTGSGGSGSDGDGGSGSTPVVPFEAIIDSFSQGSVSLQCANPSKPNKGNCSKVYSFSAGVKTSNGPGTVSYSWQSNVDSGNGSGSFLAGAGVTITTVNKEVSLGCNKNSTITIQFAVISPTFSNSSPISVNHNCNEI